MIRTKELNIIGKQLRVEVAYSLLNKLYYGLLIDPERGCWTAQDWTGYRNLSIKGKFIRAHRLSYHIMRGPIYVGKFICHYCDRKGCINPYHLFQGEHKDNVDDYNMKYRELLWFSKDEQKDGTIYSRAYSDGWDPDENE